MVTDRYAFVDLPATDQTSSPRSFALAEPLALVLLSQPLAPASLSQPLALVLLSQPVASRPLAITHLSQSLALAQPSPSANIGAIVLMPMFLTKYMFV